MKFNGQEGSSMELSLLTFHSLQAPRSMKGFYLYIKVKNYIEQYAILYKQVSFKHDIWFRPLSVDGNGNSHEKIHVFWSNLIGNNE